MGEISWINLIIGIIMIILIFLFIGRYLRTQEGMETSTSTDNTDNTTKKNISTNTNNGIAGNATAYLALLQSKVIKMQDIFLISKYHQDYENIILKLDDLIDYQMLNAAVNVDLINPENSITKLANYQNAKLALNGLIRFLDKSH